MYICAVFSIHVILSSKGVTKYSTYIHHESCVTCLLRVRLRVTCVYVSDYSGLVPVAHRWIYRYTHVGSS